MTPNIMVVSWYSIVQCLCKILATLGALEKNLEGANPWSMPSGPRGWPFWKLSWLPYKSWKFFVQNYGWKLLEDSCDKNCYPVTDIYHMANRNVRALGLKDTY